MTMKSLILGYLVSRIIILISFKILLSQQFPNRHSTKSNVYYFFFLKVGAKTVTVHQTFMCSIIFQSLESKWSRHMTNSYQLNIGERRTGVLLHMQSHADGWKKKRAGGVRIWKQAGPLGHYLGIETLKSFYYILWHEQGINFCCIKL